MKFSKFSRKILALTSLTAALTVVAVSGMSTAQAEDCIACNLDLHMYEPIGKSTLAPLDMSWISRDFAVAKVALPSFAAAPMNGLSGLPLGQSALSFNGATLPDRNTINWTDGAALPNSFLRPWDLPQSNFNPIFITSFYNSNQGFTSNPMTTPVDMNSLGGAWGQSLDYRKM